MKLFLLNMKSKEFNFRLKSIFSQFDPNTRSISKSYSEDAMVVFVSDNKRIAVDIEEKKYRSPQTISYFLDKFITFSVEHKNSPFCLEEFYELWTAMESYFKLNGEGFRTSKNFTIDFTAKFIVCNNIKVARFDFLHIKNFAICVCGRDYFDKEDIELKCFGWEEVQC